MKFEFVAALSFISFVYFAICFFGFRKIVQSARRWRWSIEDLGENARKQEERIDEHSHLRLPSSSHDE